MLVKTNSVSAIGGSRYGKLLGDLWGGAKSSEREQQQGKAAVSQFEFGWGNGQRRGAS
jgi:hypothetical protein